MKLAYQIFDELCSGWWIIQHEKSSKSPLFLNCAIVHIQHLTNGISCSRNRDCKSGTQHSRSHSKKKKIIIILYLLMLITTFVIIP